MTASKRLGWASRLAAWLRPSCDEDAQAAARRAAACRGAVPIRDLRPRQRARVCGIARAVTYPAARGTGSFQVTLWDGTGAIDVYWLGRADITGVVPGAQLVVSGMVATREELLCFYNPSYEIVA